VSTRIAVLDDYQGVARGCADWDQLGPDVEVDFWSDHIDDPAVLIHRLAGYEVVVAMRERTPFPAETLAGLTDLRLLVTTGPFNAVIDVDAAAEHGVVVCGTGGSRQPTVELTWALILAVTRGIPAEDAAIRRGDWQVGLGPELEGKTLGLCGLGFIGSAVARIGQAFGMPTIAWSENLTAERAAEFDTQLVTKAELFAQSDVLSVHLVLGPRTRGIVAAADLARMKPTSYLVNTARAPLVVEADLIEALEGGQIAGAALDVFDVEPLPADHAFRRLPNVVVTPHIGYVTRESYEVFYGDAVDDIAGYLAGAPRRVIRPSRR